MFMRCLSRSSAHGVLISQRCRSLSALNLASVGLLLPTADSASGSVAVGHRLGHQAIGAVGELVDAPQLLRRAGEGGEDHQLAVRGGRQCAIRAGDRDLEVRRARVAAGIRRRARSPTSAGPAPCTAPCARRRDRRASSPRPARLPARDRRRRRCHGLRQRHGLRRRRGRRGRGSRRPARPAPPSRARCPCAPIRSGTCRP